MEVDKIPIPLGILKEGKRTNKQKTHTQILERI